MASPLTPGKRFAVRAALVTGSTLSLIFGAQALMTLDLRDATVTEAGFNGASTQSETTAFNSNNSNSGVVVIRSSRNSNLFQSQQSASSTQRRIRTHSSH